MSTPSQVDASRRNGRNSRGPNTEDGKARSSANSFQHGLRGVFTVLPSEDQSEFNALLAALRSEHQPATPTEALLVEKMAQHEWLSRRAQLLQDSVLTWKTDTPSDRREQTFAVYLRYQTSNDRGFSKCLHELLKLRAERRREEMHQAQVRLVNAKAESRELETSTQKTVQARLAASPLCACSPTPNSRSSKTAPRKPFKPGWARDNEATRAVLAETVTE